MCLSAACDARLTGRTFLPMMNCMQKDAWQIYMGEIPHSGGQPFWVSFESDPKLVKTRANIYGRCLPCIQNLYFQLQAGREEIELGNAFNCWKVTAVLKDLDQCLALLERFQNLYPTGHVYGKLGSGQKNAPTRVVVFHTETKSECDRIQMSIQKCLRELDVPEKILISKGCAVLYETILGDWRKWQPKTLVLYPERVEALLERIRKILFWSVI